MKGQIGLEGEVPTAFETTGVVSAESTLKFKNIVVKRVCNKILVSGNVITAGSAGTGTSPCSTLLKQLRIYKGTEENKHDPSRLVLNAELATAIHLHTMAAITSKVPSPVSATTVSFLNPALAGDATYKFSFEININLKAGNYYAEAIIDSPSVLAGYSTAPTCNTSMMLEFLDLGIKFDFPDKISITTETNTRVATPPAHQIAFLCSTEIGSILRGLQYDTAYNAFQVRAVESRCGRLAARSMAVAAAATLPHAYSPGNPALVEGTVYYVFAKESSVPKEAVLEMTASTAVILYWKQLSN